MKNLNSDVKVYYSFDECKRLRKKASEHLRNKQPRKAERLAKPYNEAEHTRTVVRNSEPIHSSRACDFCGKTHRYSFITTYGSGHYNRIMCLECEKRINDYHAQMEAEANGNS